jgi:MFS family permease
MVLTLCFDAISRNVDGLGYSPFVMFSMTSLTKLPASLIILLLQDRVGRKAMASGSLLISGVFTIASGLVIAFVGAKSGNCHTVNSASSVQQCPRLVSGRCA